MTTINQARTERLNAGLTNLAAWCLARAEGQHDTETTLTMMEKKATELRHKVDKAGWEAAKKEEVP
jgi:hypothetical protein